MERSQIIKELRKDPRYKELGDYMDQRLIHTNKTIFEYLPIDGLKEGYQHLYPLIEELKAKGFFDGD